MCSMNAPVIQLRLTDPENTEEILARVPHLGAKRRQMLLDEYGEEEVLARIDAGPKRAFIRAGMGYKHASEASLWWRRHPRAA
jgi:hypothetical protein